MTQASVGAIQVVAVHPLAWHASMCTEPSRHGLHMFVESPVPPHLRTTGIIRVVDV